MQVRKRLQLNIAISVTAAGVIIALLVTMAFRVMNVVEASNIADDIVTSVYQRSEFRGEYLQSTNERARVQWYAEHEHVGLQLQALSEKLKDAEDKAVLERMSQDQRSIGKLFSNIVENRERRGPDARISREIEDRLTSQLAMRRYNAILDARHLQESTDRQLFSSLKLASWGILCVMLVLTAAGTINSWSMTRVITNRIDLLRNGAAIIGEGRLDHRIEIKENDEFGELSQAFNTMTGKLRRSYADLETEIEEREKINEQLKRTATLLDETQSIARVGGWELDVEKNALFWTEETFRIHETTSAEYAPTVETAIAFYAPESIPVISAAVKDAIDQGKEFLLELQLITAKGRRIWVEAVGKVARKDGRTVKVLGAFRDITERKQVEALRLANAYNRSLLEASLDPLVTIDANGKITDVNAATENATGLSREELIGTDFSDYFTQPQKARAGYLQVFREGSVKDYALEIRHRQGRLTQVLYNAAVYRDVDGNVIGIFAAARDITERKLAEEKLAQANAYNRSLLEASLDPLVTIDANGKITDVNAATEKVTGRSRAELIGTDFSDYFTDPDKARAGYRQVFQEGLVTDYALEIKGRHGDATPVLYNAAVFRNADNNVIGVFAAARDITALKKAEEEVRKLNRELEARVIERTTELENSNKELEAFAYSVSHDLRSPLRSIEGFSLALLEDYADRLDATGKNYLDRVRNATIRMGQLIDDLLKLSRVTRSEMNREEVDLSEIVNTIVEKLKQSHPERTADFVIANGLTGYGDGRLLTVALENLIFNAWKFSEKAARTVIEFGVTPKDHAKVFFVKDNGVGFDMAYAGKLFSPFQRLHKTADFPGTGIGLATVKRVISRHGGNVWIEAEENKGTTVYFTL